MYLDQQIKNLKENVGYLVENFDAITVSVLGALALFYYLRLILIASNKSTLWALIVAFIPLVGPAALYFKFPKKVKKNFLWHSIFLISTLVYLAFAFY